MEHPYSGFVPAYEAVRVVDKTAYAAPLRVRFKGCRKPSQLRYQAIAGWRMAEGITHTARAAINLTLVVPFTWKPIYLVVAVASQLVTMALSCVPVNHALSSAAGISWAGSKGMVAQVCRVDFTTSVSSIGVVPLARCIAPGIEHPDQELTQPSISV